MAVLTKAIIHLLVPHAEGKIKSAGLPGSNGKEQSFAPACLTTSDLPKHATGEASAVTCPLCKKTPAFKALDGLEQLSDIDRIAAEAMAADDVA